MLKTIEFGVVLRSLSVTCYFTMDAVAQGQNHKPECTFYDTTSLLKLPASILTLFSIYSTQCTLSLLHVYIHISISGHKCPESSLYEGTAHRTVLCS